MNAAAATSSSAPSGRIPARAGDFARGIIFFLSLILLYTGFAKLTDPAGFAEILRAHALIPAGATVAAWAVPIIELALATVTIYALAATLPALHFAAWAHAAIFAAFAAYCAALWLNPPRIHVPCGCGFSNALVADWSGPTIRAAALAAAAIASASLLSAARLIAPRI